MTTATQNTNDQNTNDQALWRWAEGARLILMQVALDQSLITYKELWDELNEALDVPPAGLWRRNIGIMLHRVATLNKHNEEPLLTALVVTKIEGRVSDKYAEAILERYGYLSSDPALHAVTELVKISNWVAPLATAITNHAEAVDLMTMVPEEEE